MKAMIAALALGGADIAIAQGMPMTAAITPLASGRLGGIMAVLRYQIARPDRRETAYIFLTGSVSGSFLPEEVQVHGRDGGQLHLTAQEGADCTLSAVEIIPAPNGRSAVVSAVRRFSPVLGQNEYSVPAPMEVQVYRPVRRGAPGESSVILKATGAPVGTPALCRAAEVRRAMLAIQGHAMSDLPIAAWVSGTGKVTYVYADGRTVTLDGAHPYRDNNPGNLRYTGKTGLARANRPARSRSTTSSPSFPTARPV